MSSYNNLYLLETILLFFCIEKNSIKNYCTTALNVKICL